MYGEKVELKKLIKKIIYSVKCFNLRIKSRKNLIVLFGTSAQNNLGDHAISIAEIIFIKNRFPNHKLMEIDKGFFYHERNKLKKYVKTNDMVLITGGGFLGDLWMSEEQLVRDVIADYPENHIVILPQTIYFKPDSSEKSTTYGFYQSHTNLTVCFRDHLSTNIIQKDLPGFTRFRYYPDMVLSLSVPINGPRSGALLCIRTDVEGILAASDISNIRKELERCNLKMTETSTVLDFPVPIFARNYYFKKKLREFSSAQLVVTDRLHGMIFAAITGTPCIAFDNLTGKVAGVYEWICSMSYVKCIDSIDEFVPTLDSIDLVSSYTYDHNVLEKQFHELEVFIRNQLK